MAIKDNSDYNKPFMDLFELLPEVYRSDANRAIFKNVFNRYLTKPELTRVQGYLGQGNINAITRRQIPEDDPHRQAYQLQPVLHEKVGSVDHINSWKDIVNEITRLGVDEDRFAEWGNAVRFAWAPPIDIDKLIHYRDYYWFDEADPNSRPQYITIRSRCTTAQSNLNQIQRLIDSYGATLDIDSINSATNELLVVGDFTPLYEPGFVFFVKNSTNPTPNFNDTFHTVKTAVWDPDNAVTRITLEYVAGSPVTDTFVFTSEIADGVLSLEEEELLVRTTRDCLCGGQFGWDTQLWDDNPENWNNPPPYVESTTAPTGSPLSLWYNPTANTLSEWNGSAWETVHNNFSALIERTVGTALWDFTTGCDLITTEDAGEQWATANKWFHKSEVTNFSAATQASIPIIEYEWDLELNEWAHINHVWKYRDDNFGPFSLSTAPPTLIELEPFSVYTISGTEIVLDERYGDLTDVFVPGYNFEEDGSSTLLTVEESRYESPGTGQPYRTVIVVTNPSDVTTYLTASPQPSLEPNVTSLGDAWRGYNQHWVYVGVDSTTPVNHQVENNFITVSPSAPTSLHPTGNYITAKTYYTQEYAVENSSNLVFLLDSDILVGSTRSLQERALVGFDDVRVYINDVRQFGNFDEITGDEISTVAGSPEYDMIGGSPTNVDDGFVKGIRFHSTVTLAQYDEVRVVVGEAALSDMGWYTVPVRTEEDDLLFLQPAPVGGTTSVSLVEYHKVEQVKTELNQYPMFDIYDIEGNTAYKANQLFGYCESSEVGINVHVQKRIVEDGEGDFTFQQFLLEEDNGTLYAYRQYNSRENDFWYNPEDQTLLFWDELTWTDKYDLGDELTEATVGPAEPISPVTDQLWYDTLEGELKIYDGAWSIHPDGVTEDIADETLQTIWRVGLNKEEYVPQYVDEERRPDGTVWYDRDGTEHIVDVPIGDPDGDWEIPDQLYYNHLHENRVKLTLRELFTHFSDIIDNQPHIPGFAGPARSQFHLIPSDEVNYGVGGTILEFNDGFDTFLSSAFVNNVTPLGIVEFAHDQYESSIVELRELFSRNSNDLLTDVTDASFANQAQLITDSVITLYEENDYNSLIYGDSTTYDDSTNLGIRNWIACLLYTSDAADDRT